VVATNLRGKDWLCEQDWSRHELDTILDVGFDLKRRYAIGEPHELLRGQTLFMIFFNASLRTRNSFEAGMTQLGGHAHYLEPETIYRPTLAAEIPKGLEETKERIADTARVLDRMGNAIAIRVFGKPTGWMYGIGHKIIEEFAQFSKIPVINMECDMYHPCQVMADLMAVKEHCGKFEGKKFVMSWAYCPSPWKPLAVPQSCVQGATKMGMDVVLAHPKGFDLDPNVIANAKKNAEEFGGSFEISNDMREAFEGADVVYPKSWTSLKLLPPNTKEPQFDDIKKLIEQHKDWICDEEKMDLTKNGRGKYMHCLPADVGVEVTAGIIDGPNSIVWDEAENRLHAQKAIMALIMGGRP